VKPINDEIMYGSAASHRNSVNDYTSRMSQAILGVNWYLFTLCSISTCVSASGQIRDGDRWRDEAEMLLAGCTKTTLSGISNQCRYCQVGSKLITLPVVLPVRQQQQQGEYVVLDECDDVDDDNEHSSSRPTSALITPRLSLTSQCRPLHQPL